jgi:hypothetical protein
MMYFFKTKNGCQLVYADDTSFISDVYSWIISNFFLETYN